MYLAKELGYTLSELTERLTPDELQLWVAFYEIEAEQQAEAARKARRR
jgi:hypothetical protein